jgi:hypothetical protein
MTAPTCKATIISLETLALNADFQHFIPTSSKFLYFMDTPERRVWGERRRKDRVTLQIILIFSGGRPEASKRNLNFQGGTWYQFEHLQSKDFFLSFHNSSFALRYFIT